MAVVVVVDVTMNGRDTNQALLQAGNEEGRQACIRMATMCAGNKGGQSRYLLLTQNGKAPTQCRCQGCTNTGLTQINWEEHTS